VLSFTPKYYVKSTSPGQSNAWHEPYLMGMSKGQSAHDFTLLDRIAEKRRILAEGGSIIEFEPHDSKRLTAQIQELLDKSSKPKMHMQPDVTQPSLDAIKALDGRIYATVKGAELDTLEFYRQQGRKFGVTVSIINKADPEMLAAAKSQKDADHVLKSANSLISVTAL
jgi:hypothetical protein